MTGRKMGCPTRHHPNSSACSIQTINSRRSCAPMLENIPAYDVPHCFGSLRAAVGVAARGDTRLEYTCDRLGGSFSTCVQSVLGTRPSERRSAWLPDGEVPFSWDPLCDREMILDHILWLPWWSSTLLEQDFIRRMVEFITVLSMVQPILVVDRERIQWRRSSIRLTCQFLRAQYMQRSE
jgi:hypothetical protein